MYNLSHITEYVSEAVAFSKHALVVQADVRGQSVLRSSILLYSSAGGSPIARFTSNPSLHKF